MLLLLLLLFTMSIVKLFTAWLTIHLPTFLWKMVQSPFSKSGRLATISRSLQITGGGSSLISETASSLAVIALSCSQPWSVSKCLNPSRNAQ